MDYKIRLKEIDTRIKSLKNERDDFVNEINADIDALEDERDSLEEEIVAANEDKWTEEGLRERLRLTILSRYGSIHDIRLVKLMLNPHYSNGGFNDYRPALIILDKNVDEMNHSIDPNDFCPSREKAAEIQREGGVLPSTVTLRFDE